MRNFPLIQTFNKAANWLSQSSQWWMNKFMIHRIRLKHIPGSTFQHSLMEGQILPPAFGPNPDLGGRNMRKTEDLSKWPPGRNAGLWKGNCVKHGLSWILNLLVAGLEGAGAGGWTTAWLCWRWWAASYWLLGVPHQLRAGWRCCGPASG